MIRAIGSVTFVGGRLVATLNGVDDWAVTLDSEPYPAFARNLMALYRDSYRGPSDGHYGQLILSDLAERTRGTMTIRDFPPAGPDEIP